MGNVENGVRRDLHLTSGTKPRSALESMALALAFQIDNRPDDKTLAALSRELRLTLAQIAENEPPDASNEVEKIADKRQTRRNSP